MSQIFLLLSFFNSVQNINIYLPPWLFLTTNVPTTPAVVMQNMMHVIAVADVFFIMMIKYTTIISHVAAIFYNFFTTFTKTNTPVDYCGIILITVINGLHGH